MPAIVIQQMLFHSTKSQRDRKKRNALIFVHVDPISSFPHSSLLEIETREHDTRDYSLRAQDECTLNLLEAAFFINRRDLFVCLLTVSAQCFLLFYPLFL